MRLFRERLGAARRRLNLAMSSILGLMRGLYLYFRYRSLTMLTWIAYADNIQLVARFASRVPGDVVECGTWRGGMALGMVAITGSARHYHFFDSFEGLPAARSIDGEAATKWQSDTESTAYYDNCAADEEVFRRNLRNYCPEAQTHVYAGWFSETIRTFPAGREVAVLRLDGDWYESTLECLRGLFQRVVPGGLIIIDDYYTWDGCSRAVHDYLSSIGSPSRIHQTRLSRTAYIVKRQS